MNWQKRIDRAKRKGRFGLIDRWLAESWRHCAVGELKNITFMGSAGYRIPADLKLQSLGVQFLDAVLLDDTTGARLLYNEIQTHNN